jgi:PGF-pre-PGF domain-containing protein
MRQTPTTFEGSGSNDDQLPVPSSAPVLQGAGSHVCQTVNVGGNSAISRVSVTGQDICDIIVTARKLPSLPSDVAPPEMPVYQYIDVIPARFTAISLAVVEFDVPLFSITDTPGSLNNVSLCMLNNNRTWICLPTTMTGSKNGNALYRAESQEFSLFAITIQNGTRIASPGIMPAATTVLEKSSRYESRETNISAIHDIPVKRALSGSNTGFSLILLVISTIGIFGFGIGVVLIRSRWNR